MKTLWIIPALVSALFATTYPTPEVGSQIESSQIMVKVDLIKDDNSTVNLLSGDEYIELKSDANVSAVADTITSNLPAAGTYIGVEYTVKKIKTKAKIVIDSTTYYTRETNVSSGNGWNLTTDASKYGYTEMEPSFTDKNRITFTKPLVISNADATIYFVNQFGPIQMEWSSSLDPKGVHWIGNEQYYTGILPQEPKKKISLDINYTNGTSSKTNKLTILTDANNSILGAHLSRPSNFALEGSFFKDGEDIESGYKVDIHISDSSKEQFLRIKAKIDCENGTYELKQPIYLLKNNGTTNTLPDIPQGYGLQMSGTATCKTIHLRQ